MKNEDAIVIDVADLDVIFLTYNEPKKEEFWVKVQNIVPWAKRVDGVKGSDSAHKAAADASDTDRFVLIDGDNLPDEEFFDKQLILTDDTKHCVFRWKARNIINGLCYGNGGLSCWTKDFVYNMKSHENSNGDPETAVEFCFDSYYIAMNDCYSTTYPNGSAQQAWQAGFREGVKMCLNKGVRPTLSEFEEMIHRRNLDNLLIWMSVGADVEYGIYAMSGAIDGVFRTMLEPDWDYTEVQDFDKLSDIWNNLEHPPEFVITEKGRVLKSRLNLPIVQYNAEQSKFFKHHMSKNHRNKGIMISEMDVIRSIEGW